MSKVHGIAYLDHSALNDMYEGNESEIHDYLQFNNLQVVYSDENLTEIRNSVVRREYFVDKLDKLKAFHIENPLDGNRKQTNTLSFAPVLASERLAIAEQDEKHPEQEPIDSDDAEDAFIEILSKLHGADSDSSVEELMSNVLDQVARDAEGIPDDQIAEMRSSLCVFGEVDEELKKNGAPFSSVNIEKHLGYSTAEISGVTGPNIIAKLWRMINGNFGDSKTIDDYQDHIMSVAGFQYGLDGTSNLTLIQRANDLYHWLNQIGYHKDEKIKKIRKMKGSFRDMTHAGYAMAGSTHFLCSDKRLRLKAEAIYEHLGFESTIVDTKSLADTPV